MNRPGGGDSKAENSVYGTRLNYRRESFIVINAMLLGIAATYPTCFVAGKSTIGVKLLAKHPLARDNVGVGRARNKLPGIIFSKGRIFFLHSCSAIRIKKRSFVRFGNLGQGQGDVKVKTI